LQRVILRFVVSPNYSLMKYKACLFFGTLTVFLVSGCDKPARVQKEPDNSSATASAETAPPPVAAPASTPPGQTQAQMPPQPPGEYLFLTRRISVASDSGVRGFPPGTKVKILSRKDATLTVLAEDMQLEVSVADTATTDPRKSAPASAPVETAAAVRATTKEQKAQAVQQEIQRKERARSFAQQARVAEMAARQKRRDEIAQQIDATVARRDAITAELYGGKYRNPTSSPEGRARMAEVDRLSRVVEQLNVQMSRL
jgi:hypothetical protein